MIRCQYPDLGVVNWNASNGNYLFSNTTGIEEYEDDVAGAELRFDIYPNPFSKQTKISFGKVNSAESIGHSAEGIELRIYDVTGRLVKEFFLPTAYSPGLATRSGAGLLPTVFSWSGTDDKGQKLPSGIYIIELNTGKQITRKKVVITR